MNQHLQHVNQNREGKKILTFSIFHLGNTYKTLNVNRIRSFIYIYIYIYDRILIYDICSMKIGTSFFFFFFKKKNSLTSFFSSYKI